MISASLKKKVKNFTFFSCVKKIVIVYYVPKQSSRSLYEDAGFNVWAEGEDDKTASEYKQLDCLGTYDTLSRDAVAARRQVLKRNLIFKVGRY